ncbi:MAG: aminotransferase class I/II-fold pyridoxal phosphate-dependent enzyme [Bacteroidetes bacterium]|nr:aminotransferase class I/II-fold pyridoxal phosphate-dependent enzyme [Bacteroidota bacterium]
MEEKSKHEQVQEIVNEVATLAANLGIVHNGTEDVSLDGRHITIRGQKLLFFGSCGYLGLEHDPRLKAAAMEATDKYGTQFSSSRAYVSSRYYQEAEDLMRQMFHRPSVIVQSLTVGHMSNIPVIVGDSDAVIMDAQVHDSVQTAVQLLKTRNIRVELVRHNRIDMLEQRIRSLKDSYRKIWYMADGVYSMQGDYTPVKELYKLLDRHEQLHLYLDDIHGMSWAGPHGTGYVLSQEEYHNRLFLTTGLTKAFGVAGGLLVYPDEKHLQLIRNTSKAFIFSIQMPPMVLGAVIASAKIHLTDEIYTMQNELKTKIDYFNNKAKELQLPLINENDSPIMFIGVGKPDTGYNMVRRLMNAGYFINISVFPSVSYNNTGLRIPLNNKLTIEDIDGIVNTIAEQLPLALADTNASMSDIYKSFRLVA